MSTRDEVQVLVERLDERAALLAAPFESEKQRRTSLEEAAKAAYAAAKVEAFKETFRAQHVSLERFRNSEVVVVDEFVLYEVEDPEWSRKGPFRPYSPGARFLVTLGRDNRGNREVRCHQVADLQGIAEVLVAGRKDSMFLTETSGVLAMLADAPYPSWPSYPRDPLAELVPERFLNQQGYPHRGY